MGIEIAGSDFSDMISSIGGSDKMLNKNDVNRIRLTTPKGRVSFKEEILRGNLSILESNYFMKEDLEIFGKGDADLLEIQFNLSDKGIFYQDKSSKDHITPAMSGNIAYLSSEENQANIHFQKETSYHTFDIHLPLSLLDQYVGESKKLDGFLSQIHNGISSKLTTDTIGISPAIFNSIQDIQTCTYEGLTRRIYLESKAYELIALLYEDSQRQHVPQNLSADDRESIHLAASIIRGNLEEPFTIPQLARQAGINQTKLKAGFKMVFGNTVFGYLQDIRMHQAKRYLLDTKLSIQEIGIRLGYQNTANFSNAFKKILGYSPMKLREKSNNR
ncbi:helix-turn-helix transcriptional regulator [Sphingobacterium sp. JB170]|uniref:helix-turn-helix transcriptional regulator n=1 Tax=Sphingobacterium sp. JB170 TaxID=1434842 RepID=UPI000B34E8B1|nr:AraC family transcriptional regulator [Sphingobacterium sp. JB170]